MVKKILERDIQNSILEYLGWRRITAWRNNSGMQFNTTAQGKKYMIRMGPKGSPDIIGYTHEGRFLGIEVKQPGKKLTPEQEKFLNDLNKAGGLGFMACCLEDVQKVLG